MQFQNVGRPRFVMETVNILRHDVLQPASLLQAGQAHMGGVGRHISKLVPARKASRPVSRTLRWGGHKLHKTSMMSLFEDVIISTELGNEAAIGAK
jgi:hypothetical protein